MQLQCRSETCVNMNLNSTSISSPWRVLLQCMYSERLVPFMKVELCYCAATEDITGKLAKPKSRAVMAARPSSISVTNASAHSNRQDAADTDTARPETPSTARPATRQRGKRGSTVCKAAGPVIISGSVYVPRALHRCLQPCIVFVAITDSICYSRCSKCW